MINKDCQAVMATFFIIFLYSSYTVTNNLISSATTITLWLILFGALVILMKRISKNVMLVASLLLILTLITHILNDDMGKYLLVYSFTIVVSVAYVGAFDFDEFKDSYIRVMYVIALISLVGFSVCLAIPAVEKVFYVHSSSGIDYTYWIIFVKKIASIHLATPRNYGMFWEPGAYQTFLNLALLLEIFNEKSSFKRIFVFIIAILTTLSTTGYLAMAVILLLPVVKKKVVNKKIRNIIISIIICITLVVLISPDFLNIVFGKVNGLFLNKGELSQNISGSAKIRYYSLIKPIEVFIENPFFGVGYKGVIEKTWDFVYGMPTCTFINWFAMYGFFYGVVMFAGLIRFAIKISHYNRIAFAFSLLGLLIVMISENYVNAPIFFILVFYGFSFDKMSIWEIERL